MNHEPALTEGLRTLLAQLTSLTTSGALHWEKQAHSSHRYARWNDILLILGPDAPLEDHQHPRYLHLTPLFSQGWLEIKSDDPALHNSLLALGYAVEGATEHQLPTDPFALTDELLRLLKT
jgi:hypothetical protein